MSNVEQWRAVVGYEGLYEVSDFGRVRGITRVIVHKNGVPHTAPGGIRKLFVNASGHLSVRLNRGGGGATWLIHRLVLGAFVGPCPAGKECCHWDGNPANNLLDNLRWGTRAENYTDRVRCGGGNKGSRHGNAKLSERIVSRYVRPALAAGHTQRAIAERLGVSPAIIGQLARGETWRHVL